MRWIVAVLLSLHGLIHLMGFAKAFGYANLPQLTQPVSREMGLLWLAAGLLMVASAAMMGRAGLGSQGEHVLTLLDDAVVITLRAAQASSSALDSVDRKMLSQCESSSRSGIFIGMNDTSFLAGDQIYVTGAFVTHNGEVGLWA